MELKNDLAIRGTLHSVDQYLNIKLENTRVVDQDKYPHMVFSHLLLFSLPRPQCFYVPFSVANMCLNFDDYLFILYFC